MPILKVDSITKRFGGLVALNNVSFTVNENEIVSIIGPNGAGKSTMFMTITGFHKPTSGKIEFLGEDITSLPSYMIASRGIVTTFQKTKVFSGLSVLEAVETGFHCRTDLMLKDLLLNSKRFRESEANIKAKASEILSFCNIDEKAYYSCKNLSYGEQRILEIAVALAAEPKLLLLDEPAAGLNPQESKQLMKLIYNIRDRGITVLLVEHDMNLVMSISDRIVVINFGNKIAEGTPEEVSHNKEVIKAYLGERENDAAS